LAQRAKLAECSGRMVWPGSAEDFSRVQASPSLDGDKVMRLRAQTAKIEGGFVIFPEEAPWLDTYLRELFNRELTGNFLNFPLFKARFAVYP
jgi:hypothetical protein